MVRQIIASSLREHSTAFGPHSPDRILNQYLAAQVLIIYLAQVGLADGFERAQFGFAQWAGFCHFEQVTLDHFLDRCAYAVCPFDRAGLVQFSFTLADPYLSGLFTGEGLTLLVDLHPITDQAYLCRVTDAAVCASSCSDRGHSQLVQFEKWLVLCTSDLPKTPFYPLTHALNT